MSSELRVPALLSIPAQLCLLLLPPQPLLRLYTLPFPCGTVRSVSDILINFDLKTEAREQIRLLEECIEGHRLTVRGVARTGNWDTAASLGLCSEGSQ